MYHKPLGNSGDAEPGSFRQPIAWRQIQFLFMILEIGRMGGDVGVRDLSGCCQLFLKTQRNTGGVPLTDENFRMTTIQLSSDSFLQMLALSGLLSDEQMTVVRKQFSSTGGGVPAGVSTQEIMIWLLKRKLITPWHAEKLIQGRFRGFFLGEYKLLPVQRG